MLLTIYHFILTIIILLSELIWITVQAEQLPPTMTLQVDSNGSGKGSISVAGSKGEPAKQIECDPSGNPCTYTYDTATWVTLTATPDNESIFYQWQPDRCHLIAAQSSSQKGVAEVFLSQNSSCIATFKIKPVKLTLIYAGVGSGRVKLSPTGQVTDCNNDLCRIYTDITTVTMTPVPNLGAAFANWTGHEDCQDGQVTMDKEDKTCVVNFIKVPTHKITTTVTGSGKGRVDTQPPGPEYNEGTSITLTAIPEAGSFFTGWSEDCSGLNSTFPLTMTTDKKCTANFSRFHNLTVNLNGNGTVTVEPTGTACGANCNTYHEGTTITLTAIPKIDSSFSHWEAGCTGKSAQTQVVMEGVKTCAAVFELLPPPSVQLSMPQYLVEKVKNETVVFVTRAASSLGAISVNYQTQDGTALAGKDYTAVNGTLKWDNGDTTQKEIKIPLLENIFFGKGKNLTISLFNLTGNAVLGSNPTAKIQILDKLSETDPNLASSTLQLIANRYAVTEAEGKINITVERVGDNRRATTVDYATQDETALVGQDYTATQGTLKWDIGDSQAKTVTVPIIVDTNPEINETFNLSLSNPTNLAQLGIPTKAQITILDSLGDPTTTLSPGWLQFTTPRYQVLEEGKNVILAVSRIQGNHGAVSVAYKTQDETATANQDYTAVQSVLAWADGETSDKNILIPIRTDTLPEGDETFSVYLSNPTGEASLGTLSQATVSILDSLATPDTTANSPGRLQFAANNYQVNENSGSLTVTITRTQGSKGVVEVTYATQSETATDKDFVATQGTFRWLDGEKDEKSFSIGLTDDGLIEGDENFFLELTNPTGGAKLGDHAKAMVTITDNDATTVQFSSNHFVADEGNKPATIKLSRTGGKIGQVTVGYEIVTQCPDTHCATLGKDYQAPLTGIITWINGDTSEKSFTIRLLEDREAEGNETLLFRLTDLKGNAQLGTLTEAILTLVDNDSGECKPAPIIDCYLENHDNILQDVRITPFGTVVGGQLTGQVNNEGVVQDVTLLANTQLLGGNQIKGVVRGNIQTEAGKRAIIDNVEVVDDTNLTNLIVGKGAVLDSQVVLGKNVAFVDNSNIPYLADLKTILGEITVPELNQAAIWLTSDVLLYSAIGGIVEAINGLPELIQLNLTLWQNPDNGYLVLDTAPLHYTALPIQVQQVWGKPTIDNTPFKSLGLTLVPNGEVIFVTHTGRKITALPVVQDPKALQWALEQLDLPPMTMQPNGNLKVSLANGNYYMARPNLFAADMPNDVPLGLHGTASAWIDYLSEIFLAFDVSDPQSGTLQRRQQFMYPAAADPEALYALAAESDSQTVLYNDGRVYAYRGKGEQKIVYKGVLDYLITPGRSATNSVQLDTTKDVNGDGNPDYEVIYPNGDRQVMYYCAVCFEE
ncbi:Na-Ca exchanger/integrin-beta4 [Thioploca ingrica]|uniref:Na-Ca exchanger/integrin-beta4 n=1 Tax=Thioploca ingrica TaxID=40754 RepID=A0A090AB82_9GAMM|nr:Na-Ca exchanger/integrin-beta4 [Thioploca ingrica]